MKNIISLENLMVEENEALPDHLRCNRTDGRKWRCRRRVMDGKNYCEDHYRKICKKKNVVSKKTRTEEDEALPDHLRCSKTRGGQWRCRRRKVDNEKLCEIHIFSRKNKFPGKNSEIISSDKSFVDEAESLLDNLRCTRTDGRRWRCKRRVMDNEKLCEVHILSRKRKFPRKNSEKVSSGKILLKEAEALPDNLRCARTDGRQWRCERRAMDNKKLCEIHHLQGLHRQHKQKVPESLKIQRKKRRKTLDKPYYSLLRAKRVKSLSNKAKRRRWIGVSEALDEALKKMKLKKGDLQLELIRMFLQRQVERRKKRELKANCEAELTRELPNGLMAISPALSPLNFDNAGPYCEIKIGIGSGCFTRRCFRSKNIESLPIGPVKLVPFAKNVANFRRVRRKNCHWCLKRGFRSLIKCSSCQKQYFCIDCIKERHLNMQDEVKVACPVCRGACRCKACSANQSKNIGYKVLWKGKSKVERIQPEH